MTEGLEKVTQEEMLRAVESIRLRRLKAKCRMRAYQELAVLHKEEFKDLLRKEYQRERIE